MGEVQEVTLDEAAARMGELGYDPPEVKGIFATWLDRGDMVVIFENADLSSLGERILGFAAPWSLTDELPPHAWDGLWGLGWRYLPAKVVRPTEGPLADKGGA